MAIEQSVKCDAAGCVALRRSVNNWYVVLVDAGGIHIYHWEKCPVAAMASGYHFCGHAHAVQFVSSALQPQTVDPQRESTLELKPPLARDGSEN